MGNQASPLLQALMDEFRNPEVPVDLVTYRRGPISFEEFLKSGAEVYTMPDLAACKHANREVHQFDTILDFGRGCDCDCGRILRFLAGGASRWAGTTAVSDSPSIRVRWNVRGGDRGILRSGYRPAGRHRARFET
jgi:hypothetical protein